jgi:hypothetical protein
MMMAKAKMAAAQAYIDAKEYDHAREILYTINDPSADRWLDQLEQVAPGGSTHLSGRMKAGVTRSAHYSRFGRILFVLVAIALLRVLYLVNDDLILITQPLALFMWYKVYALVAASRGYRA